MNNLEFNPQIFTVTTHSGIECNWDLLTLDGNSPNETIYFLNKFATPTSDQQDEIVSAIENETWLMSSISDDEILLNYSIDITIFDNQVAYKEIVNRLNDLQSKF